ncbi:MAG: hypothetical protein IPN03_23180 [Holophagales bacterium]|nr:hypothetical protein [Holophagales bacterium]MBK9376539.1 hypothetical protein [Holophagales bacterium]
MTEKALGATWQVFRLTLRDTAGEYARAHLARVSAFPLEPTAPERLAPVVDAILAELDRSCAAEEASPVLRVIKRTFRPSREEQYRKRLKKAFDAYSGAWRARAAS